MPTTAINPFENRPAAVLKARIIAAQTREAQELAALTRARTSANIKEATSLLETAKAYMDRHSKLFYDHERTVSDGVAEVLKDIGAKEGFIVEYRFPEWGYGSISIKIP